MQLAGPDQDDVEGLQAVGLAFYFILDPSLQEQGELVEVMVMEGNSFSLWSHT